MVATQSNPMNQPIVKTDLVSYPPHLPPQKIAAGGRVLGESPKIIPWQRNMVAVIWIDRDGTVYWANDLARKRSLLTARLRWGGRILVAWPGQYRQDIIELRRSEVAISLEHLQRRAENA